MNLIYKNFRWTGAFLVLLISAAISAGCGSSSSEDEHSGYDLVDNINLDDYTVDADVHDQDGHTSTEDASSLDPDSTDSTDTTPPPDPDIVEIDVDEAIGAACDSDDDCPLGHCLVDDDFEGGYCTTLTDCEYDDQCPEGTICQQLGETNFCARRCDDEDDCREGYVCEESVAGRFKGCTPDTEPTELKPGADGRDCTGDNECASGVCLEDPEWPGGFCTTLECDTRDDCQNDDDGQAADNRCLHQDGGTNLCVRMCQRQSDCREDYLCQPIGGGQAFCAPNPMADIGLDDVDDYPFPITCGLSAEGNQLEIDYDIADDTTSYMITPIARDGESLSPTRIDLPDGGRVTFRGANDFQTVPGLLFGYLNPLVMPAIEDLSDQLQAGSHRLVLRTRTQDLCYYLFEESTPGTRIDLNIYLVGLGLDAEEAANDADFAAVLDAFDAIYAQADVEVGEVRFREITGEDADTFQIVRSDFDIQRLVALSERPENSDSLSLNVFFVRGMYLDEEGSAIGISQGLPGPAGIHGTPASGVVFTSEYLGQTFQDYDGGEIDGNEFTGIVMAHEVGHYLGLFHTSEQYGQGHDPISDTPQCSYRDFPERCPDLGNLMFPFADITHTEVTPGQAHVIKVNPLTKD